MMDDRSNKLVLVPVLALLFVMIVYQYICPAGTHSCHFRDGQSMGPGLFSAQDPQPSIWDDEGEEEAEEEGGGVAPRSPPRFNFTAQDLARFVNFNIKGEDVLVFLHIQKTGGTTFGRHLVRNIRLEQPCDCRPGQKKCTCHRPGRQETWLFSRFSTGWSCGLHADWTELTNCVPAVMGRRSGPSPSRRPEAGKPQEPTQNNLQIPGGSQTSHR
ncbi:heparan-sulfate 6-O-sulfotransferase 3-B-like [Ambystoma mexicanum]|uniref:heparan-sulfate 6-O-sulfotransferase 3-B-like n=1 Tax=Ambystoma mexicanum TaxID=8296 RepID=UPI0037E74627